MNPAATLEAAKADTDDMIKAICAAVVLGEDEDSKPVHLEPREARQALEAANVRWLPIDQADRSIATVQSFPEVSVTLRNSYPVWVRDEDGRTYEAVWSEGHANYWWDLEGESPVDPVEFMPHPLDLRYHPKPSSEPTKTQPFDAWWEHSA